MPADFLFVVEPEEIFCNSEIRFFNQPVGIILAETMELAYEAAKLVEILYAGNGKQNYYNFNIFKMIKPFDSNLILLHKREKHMTMRNVAISRFLFFINSFVNLRNFF